MRVNFDSVACLLSEKLLGVFGSVALIVHKNVSLGVGVDTKTNGFIFVVIYLVQMAEHDVSD